MQSVFQNLFLLLALTCCALVTTCVSSHKRNLTSQLPYEAPLSKKGDRVILPGRYVGYLKVASRSEKISVVADLLHERAKGAVVKVRMFMRLSLDSFDGPEFSTYYFADGTFNENGQRLRFVGTENAVKLKEVKVMSRYLLGGQMQRLGEKLGDFVLVYGGARADHDPEKLVKSLYPRLPIASSLEGKYEGLCQDKKVVMNVISTRWNEARYFQDDIFKGIRLSGEMAVNDRMLCGEGATCIKEVYEDGVYNLFKNEISWKTKDGESTCARSENRLTCGTCVLAAVGKTSTNIASESSVDNLVNFRLRPDQMTMPKKGRIPLRPDYSGVLDGEFFGYLFNEFTGQHQLVRLKVGSEMIKEEGMTKATPLVTGVSTLFFGPTQSSEFIVHRFMPAFYSGSAPHFIFNGPGEALLQITRWNLRALRGVWYAKTIGRVGTVELVRGQPPLLPPDAKIVPQVSGSYQSRIRRMNLLATADLSDTETNFYPLQIAGITADHVDANRRRFVKMGFYDFYTGRIALQLDNKRIVKGQVGSDGFNLTWPVNDKVGLALAENGDERFNYNKDPFFGATAQQMFDLIESEKKR